MRRNRKDRIESLIRELVRIGIPLRELEKRFGGHYSRYSRLKESRKSFCKRTRRVLSELSGEEIEAIKSLLRFVSPRWVAEQLNICFRFKRCPECN